VRCATQWSASDFLNEALTWHEQVLATASLPAPDKVGLNVPLATMQAMFGDHASLTCDRVGNTDVGGLQIVRTCFEATPAQSSESPLLSVGRRTVCRFPPTSGSRQSIMSSDTTRELSANCDQFSVVSLPTTAQCRIRTTTFAQMDPRVQLAAGLSIWAIALVGDDTQLCFVGDCLTVVGDGGGGGVVCQVIFLVRCCRRRRQKCD
jgi:hypothetical protein